MLGVSGAFDLDCSVYTPRTFNGTDNVPHSGQRVILIAPFGSKLCVRFKNSSSVTRSIKRASGSPAQRCGPMPKAT